MKQTEIFNKNIKEIISDHKNHHMMIRNRESLEITGVKNSKV